MVMEIEGHLRPPVPADACKNLWKHQIFFPQQRQNAMGSLHNIDFGVLWARWGGSGKEPGSEPVPGFDGFRRRCSKVSMGSDQFRRSEGGSWELVPGFDRFRGSESGDAVWRGSVKHPCCWGYHLRLFFCCKVLDKRLKFAVFGGGQKYLIDVVWILRW